VVILAIPSPPYVRVEAYPRPMQTAIDSVAVNSGKVPLEYAAAGTRSAAGPSPASSRAGLEVVLCDTGIYQMTTGSRQGAKLDSPDALRKPKMVQSPHYKSFSFRQPPYQKYILFNHPFSIKFHVGTTINAVNSLNGNCAGLDIHWSRNARC
jgi:hypothetical protein